MTVNYFLSPKDYFYLLPIAKKFPLTTKKSFAGSAVGLSILAGLGNLVFEQSLTDCINA